MKQNITENQRKFLNWVNVVYGATLSESTRNRLTIVLRSGYFTREETRTIFNALREVYLDEYKTSHYSTWKKKNMNRINRKQQ